ncbi:MAG: hypothetical protein ACI4VN_01285 [Clostridia bacterium]
MEEKNKGIRISLSTLFLILAIIAMLIMGYFLYTLNNDKIIEAAKVSNLTNQISRLENTVNNENDEENLPVDQTQSTTTSPIDMDNIYLPQISNVKSEETAQEWNLEHYIEREIGYINVKATDSQIECTVLDNTETPSNYKPGKTIITGCDERIVNIEICFRRDADGIFVYDIFLLTSSKNVYVCNTKYVYDIANDGLQANLIMRDAISIGTVSGGGNEGDYLVVALKDDGSYEICNDDDRDGK